MINLSLASYLPSILTTSTSTTTAASKSIAKVPSLSELQKQAELIASSIPSIPIPSLPTNTTSPITKSRSQTKGEILREPEKSKSRGLPIPTSHPPTQNKKSWYTFSSSTNEDDLQAPVYQEKRKEYIDSIDIGHGFDHIHRLGKNQTTPTTTTTTNKLVKVSGGGFKPIQTQTQYSIPNEKVEENVEPKLRCTMKESKVYARSVSSLNQPSINDMRQNDDRKENRSWIDWVSCKACI